jgi:hypothetical protein
MLANEVHCFEHCKHEFLNLPFLATLTQAVVSATPKSPSSRLKLYPASTSLLTGARRKFAVGKASRQPAGVLDNWRAHSQQEARESEYP